ncbi:MAG: sigma-70 family RNA polymerase sigma factor [Thermomicrobiales bacterium]
MTLTDSTAGDDLLELDDATLATRVAAGSAEALEVLYDRYSRIVLSFATRMLGDRQSGEELLQEVFLRAWQQAHNYSAGRGSFATWLLSITHNMSIDEIRKRRRRPQRAESADPVLMLTNVTDQSPSVEESAELGALRETMARAIRTLPDAQRRAIELAYYRGLTQREIAEELGEPLGTIKTRMRLGMRKLRDYLETHEVELA